MELIIAAGVVVLIGIGAWRVLSGRAGLPPIDITPDPPQAFGYKISWLAVPATSPEEVTKALGLADPRFARTTFHPCNWESAFARIYKTFLNREVFVTPPVDGWVFVVNWNGTEDQADTYKPVLEILSEQFGEAYFFANHRVVSYVAWGAARDGKLLRLYSEADFEELLNEGEPPAEEVELDLTLCAEWHAALEADLSPAEEDEIGERLPDERTVLSLAAAWSVDPTTLDGREVAGLGRLRSM